MWSKQNLLRVLVNMPHHATPERIILDNTNDMMVVVMGIPSSKESEFPYKDGWIVRLDLDGNIINKMSKVWGDRVRNAGYNPVCSTIRYQDLEFHRDEIIGEASATGWTTWYEILNSMTGIEYESVGDSDDGLNRVWCRKLGKDERDAPFPGIYFCEEDPNFPIELIQETLTFTIQSPRV